MYSGEYLNSISHMAGAVLALVGLGALLTVGLQSGEPRLLVGYSVYGASLVMLYTASTLYHSFQPPHLKQLFRLLDHISIYLLIAGTYTPFMLVSLWGPTGTTILIAIWSMALIGTLSELFLRGRAVKLVQMLMFLGMGWACLIDIEHLRAALPGGGFTWLLSGGIAYTTGVVFYVLDKLRWLDHAHGIWHVFVLIGSIFHFIAVIAYVR